MGSGRHEREDWITLIVDFDHFCLAACQQTPGTTLHRCPTCESTRTVNLRSDRFDVD